MAAAITTSTATTTSNEMAPNIQAQIVAQAISLVFQECLDKISLEDIQKRNDSNPLSFEFHLCENAKSHPCFGSLAIPSNEASVQFLLKVGEELKHLIPSSNFSYNIEVSEYYASDEKDISKFISSNDLTIKCFGKTDKAPRVYENCDIIMPTDTMYTIYKNYSDKTWIKDGSRVNFQ